MFSIVSTVRLLEQAHNSSLVSSSSQDRNYSNVNLKSDKKINVVKSAVPKNY